MKFLFYILSLVILFLAIKIPDYNKIPEEDHKVYLVYRATENKQNIIAKDFNVNGSIMTHVGLGIKINGKLNIYNVSNVKFNANGSALLNENLDEFLKVDGLIDYSIWSYSINTETKDKLLGLMEKELDKTIQFDYEFCLDNGDDNLYCSEFVYNILKQLNIANSLEPYIKELNSFYNKALGVNKLTYIPVDIFQQIKGFVRLRSI